MKWRVFLLFFSIFGYLTAQENSLDFNGKQEDPDMEALRKWIRQKRMVTIKELGGELSLSGEVRTEMQATGEKKNGISQRGPGGATTKPSYAFDVEVNLMFDYHTDRTWASAKLEFDNDMGINSGTTNRISLERAYFGGRAVDGDTFYFDLELGRRYLGNVFDSKIEFSSLFDGLLFKFNKASEKIGDFYLNTGAFLVDDQKNHFGYVGEMGMLRILNSGLFLKYSLIDWKKDYSIEVQKLRYDYVISQGILGWQGVLPKYKKYYKLYAAGLFNHAAEPRSLTDNKRAAWAWYAGFSLGQVRKANDWALNLDYQMVAAQAIPDYDAGGIKRGNAAGVGLYTSHLNGKSDGKPETELNSRADAVGSCNYKGFQVDFLYAITNALTVLQHFQISDTLDRSIGPNLKYKQYEIEFIYAF